MFFFVVSVVVVVVVVDSISMMAVQNVIRTADYVQGASGSIRR